MDGEPTPSPPPVAFDNPPTDCAGILDEVLETAPEPNTVVTVDGVTPSSGLRDGGFRVRIDGAGFDPACMRVYVGDAVADQVLFPSNTHLSCRLPAAAGSGRVDVLVVTPDGIGALFDGFEYVDEL